MKYMLYYSCKERKNMKGGLTDMKNNRKELRPNIMVNINLKKEFRLKKDLLPPNI